MQCEKKYEHYLNRTEKTVLVKCQIGNLKKLENIFLYIILLRFWASIRTSIML